MSRKGAAAEERSHSSASGTRGEPRGGERRPRGARWETSERLAFIRQLRRVLCAGAAPVTMLQHVARLAAACLCEYCIVDVVEPEGVRRVVIAHADASLLDRLHDLAEAFAPKPGGRIERMIATGRPELRRSTPTGRAARAKDLDFWDGFEPTSYAAAPIVADGAVVAILTFAASRTPLRFDESRLEFIREVAAWCGLALEATAAPEPRRASRPPAKPRFSEPPVSGHRTRSRSTDAPPGHRARG